MKKLILLFMLLFVFGITGTVNAELWDRGGGLIYDDVLDITWLQDTQYAGRTNWYAGIDLTDQLVYGGYEDWRLPSALNLDDSGPTYGYHANHELGHMFFNNLGGSPNPTFTDGNGEIVSFQNLQSNGEYWTSTTYTGWPHDDENAWFLNMWDGLLHYGGRAKATSTMNCWAVRDGDVVGVEWTVATQTVTEGSQSVIITAELTGILGSDVSVPYTVSGSATGDGLDHNLVDGEIIISAGQLTGSRSFDVMEDILIDPYETIIITMGEPTNGLQGATSLMVITITDQNDLVLHVKSDIPHTFKDSSIYNFPVIAGGSVMHESFGNNTAIAFNGVSDFLRVPYKNNWDFDTGNFTIDLWANFAVAPDSPDGILSTWNTGDSNGYAIQIENGSIQWFDPEKGFLDTGISPIPEQWYHLAVVRSGDSLEIYVNGNLEANGTGYQNVSLNAAGKDVIIGRRLQSDIPSSDYFNGHMDEIRIDKGLTRWTTGFPTELPSPPM